MATTDQLEENKKIYRRYIEILNAQDFNALPEFTNAKKYKEICVGFTTGWVNMEDAVTSLKKVLKGIPNLNAQIEDVVAEDNKVYARLKVTGTQEATCSECRPPKIATKSGCLIMQPLKMEK